jgi:hypothetical protein
MRSRRALCGLMQAQVLVSAHWMQAMGEPCKHAVPVDAYDIEHSVSSV